MSQRFDSTVEAGELALEDPVEESEASASRIDRGKHVEHIEVLTHVNVNRSNSFGDHVDGEAVGRGTGCSNAGTSGSVGALGR